MISGVTVPHQTTADGSQYAVSAKATTKDNHVGNDDVNKQQENQEVYAYYDMYIPTGYYGHGFCGFLSTARILSLRVLLFMIDSYRALTRWNFLD